MLLKIKKAYWAKKGYYSIKTDHFDKWKEEMEGSIGNSKPFIVRGKEPPNILWVETKNVEKC